MSVVDSCPVHIRKRKQKTKAYASTRSLHFILKNTYACRIRKYKYKYLYMLMYWN